MPQMSPINWLSLYIMFSIIFMIFNIMNYYMFYPLMPKLNNLMKNKSNSFLWKW
nr:ATP synthase F0 subunit 8 [Lophosia sp.]